MMHHKKQLSQPKSAATALITNPDGKNGGWTGSTVVAE
jgi:hypothetical protein